MREYGNIPLRFWTGRLAKRIRADRNAQVVALYLITGTNSHMTGLYYLPLHLLSHETGIPMKVAAKALQSLSQAGFVSYDPELEYVWVPDMARIDLGESLKPTDKRVAGIVKYLLTLGNSPFIKSFVSMYGERFCLSAAPGWEELQRVTKGISEEHRRGIEEASDPLRSPEPDPDPDREPDPQPEPQGGAADAAPGGGRRR